MYKRSGAMSLAVVALVAVVVGACGSSTTKGGGGMSQEGIPTNTPSIVFVSPTAAGGGAITIDQMCAAFERTAGANGSKVKSDCDGAPTYMQNGNSDAQQCVVNLQVASELADNNDYSVDQAYNACDPGGVLPPGGDTTPLNADHKTLDN
jgi:hypothetical protein